MDWPAMQPLPRNGIEPTKMVALLSITAIIMTMTYGDDDDEMGAPSTRQ